jgi:hypothetical protein
MAGQKALGARAPVNEARPPVTREYAVLSCKIGYMASALDLYFQDSIFVACTSAMSWMFSEEVYTGMLDFARQKGVPETYIASMESRVARHLARPGFIEYLIQTQHSHDRTQ